jgi:hypothetical protein
LALAGREHLPMQVSQLSRRCGHGWEMFDTCWPRFQVSAVCGKWTNIMGKRWQHIPFLKVKSH